MLPNSGQEAHLTFISDLSAHSVLLQHELYKRTYKKQPFEIEPAYTWEQPPGFINKPPELIVETDENTSEICMLNEDCLLHLFKFLDIDSLVNMADVCKLFNRLLHQQYFPRIRNYEVNCNDDLTITLAKVRRSLICIGSYITDLTYKAKYEEIETYVFDEYRYEDFGYTTKFLSIIAQNVGKNIRRAYFEYGFDNDNRIMMIAPILQHLKSLEIADRTESFYFDIDFCTLCPNLTEFKVNLDMPMIVGCKSWPSLRSFSVKNNKQLNAETLISFIQQNPQITCLEFDIFDDNRLLFLAIAEHLPTLKNLTIANNNSNSFSARRTVDSFDFIKKLPLLKVLKVNQILVNDETLISIVCFTRQLKALHIQECEINISNELILKLFNVLKRCRNKSDDALQLYLEKSDLEKLYIATNGEFEGYLQLK